MSAAPFATRRRWAVALALVATMAGAACSRFPHAVGPDTGRYLASKTGERYHRPECAVARKISGDQLLYYRTGDDAYRDGFTPCKVCRPERQQ